MPVSNSRATDAGVVTGAGDALRSLSFAAPLHPILVHFTIALTSTSLLFEVMGRVFHVPALASAAWWTIVLSVVLTVLTLATGVVSRLRLAIGEGTARSYLRLHMALGPTFFGMLVAVVIWRGALWQGGRTPGWWYLVVLGATVAVMGAQGYLGGELVYRWGAEVKGEHRGLRQRETRERSPRESGAGDHAHQAIEGRRA